MFSTDGTTHECDILVGADGIHSTVRKLILGPDDPAASAKNSGWWGIMVLKPYEEARSCIESLNIEDAREHGFVGDGTYLMWKLLSHGQLLQLVVTGYDEHVDNEWTRMVTTDEIRKLYHHWPEDLRKAVLEVRTDCCFRSCLPLLHDGPITDSATVASLQRRPTACYLLLGAS